MVYREQYYIHRCPRCNSDHVGQTSPKGKSDLHKGLEIISKVTEVYCGGNGSITSLVSDSIAGNQNGFICNKCGATWQSPNIKDETPIHVLEQVKEEETKKRRSKLIRLSIWAVVSFIVGLICFYGHDGGIIKTILYGFLGICFFLADFSLIIHVYRTWNELNYYKSIHPEYLRKEF